jgi:acyl-CoA reductase-like NAD-dependent aldehyde dehydrogenase
MRNKPLTFVKEVPVEMSKVSALDVEVVIDLLQGTAKKKQLLFIDEKTKNDYEKALKSALKSADKLRDLEAKRAELMEEWAKERKKETYEQYDVIVKEMKSINAKMPEIDKSVCCPNEVEVNIKDYLK